VERDGGHPRDILARSQERARTPTNTAVTVARSTTFARSQQRSLLNGRFNACIGVIPSTETGGWGVMRANIAASAESGRVLSTNRVQPAQGRPGDAVVPEGSDERSRRAVEARKDGDRASDHIHQDGTGEARSGQSRGDRKLRMIANSIRRPSRCRRLRRTTFRALRTRTDRRGDGDRDRFDHIG
jgi:hypothetical protein